jgi:glycosyltransferase involved in cell wall biosynthesis
MAKILMLTQVLPYPADSGPKAKTLSTLKYFAARHDVTLASFVRDDPAARIDALRRWCRAVHVVPLRRTAWREVGAFGKSLWTGLPWLMIRDERREMHDLVDALSAREEFDVAFADQLNMAQYARRVRARRHVLDLHNALWLLYERLAATMPVGARRALFARERSLLRRYEGEMCRSFDRVLTVSEEDRAALRAIIGAASPDPQVIPISLDGAEQQPLVRSRTADRIVYIGTMYWPPNVDGVLWFVREVLPLLRRMRPDAALDCIGARPPAHLISAVRDDPAVNIVGYVEDPTPLLRAAAVMIVPLRAGGGMRVKILQALAQGMPIVTTSLGGEGIALTHGHDALIADRPSEFAAAVADVLSDKVLAERLGRNARALFEARYEYRTALAPLDALFDDLRDSVQPATNGV